MQLQETNVRNKTFKRNAHKGTLNLPRRNYLVGTLLARNANINGNQSFGKKLQQFQNSFVDFQLE